MSNKSNEDVKVIHVYVNGNRLLKPRRVLIDKRKVQPWYRVLQEITLALDQRIIAKRLFTAESGTSIHSFSELEHNANYVASEIRRELVQYNRGYADQKHKIKYVNEYANCSLWEKNVHKDLTLVRPDLMLIYVHKNSRPQEKAIKIVLTKKDLVNWIKTLEFIARRLDLLKETFKCLYTVHGRKVCGPWELQHGATYVAVEYGDEFLPFNYKDKECVSVQKWKFGVPHAYKPKTERCVHAVFKTDDSWKKKIVWKHFNKRYADVIEQCECCRERYPCPPMCECPSQKHSIPPSSYWATQQRPRSADTIESDQRTCSEECQATCSKSQGSMTRCYSYNDAQTDTEASPKRSQGNQCDDDCDCDTQGHVSTIAKYHYRKMEKKVRYI